jgi:WD40 repeat protein
MKRTVTIFGRFITFFGAVLLLVCCMSSPDSRDQDPHDGEWDPEYIVEDKKSPEYDRRDPVLRINTDMHHNRINRVDCDREGRYLITASHDKSARVWEVETGELIRIIRVPVGEGTEGEVYSAAISPDGKTAVLGGFLEFEGTGNKIFLFDIASGELIHTISDLSSEIIDLEYSPDGAFIAAATHRSEDLVVIDVRDYSALYLGGYEGESYSVAWAPDNRLATVSYDGYLRLYAPDLTLIKRVHLQGGQKPYGLDFSPGGGKIAVSFTDTPLIKVFDGRTLQLLYEPDVSQKNDKDSLGGIAWSTDGRYLCAGGYASVRLEDEWFEFVRIWDRGGAGNYTDIPAAANTINDLKALPNGQLAVVGLDPVLVILNPFTGETIWKRESPKLDYRLRNQSHFRIDGTGSVISVEPRHHDEYTLDILDREVRDQGTENPSYVDGRGEMEFSDWKSSPSPKLNGKDLGILQSQEINRSVCVAGDGRFAVLGTNWHIFGLEPSGSVRFRVDTPGDTWALNISANGRVFAAALDDGTIRWYRTSDGEHLFSFFLHVDRDRWILWTPEGYYDASPGGEELIGWQINHGPGTTPSFYPTVTFRDRFYRPDILRQLLKTYDVDEAIEIANSASNRREGGVIFDSLPPLVNILSPTRNEGLTSREVTLEVDVRTPENAPVTEFRVMVNGQRVSRRGLEVRPSGTVRSITIDLAGVSGEEAVITVLAANRHGFGPPAEVAVRIRDYKEFSAPPKLYLLGIGISDYRDDDLNLLYASKDAANIMDYFESQQGKLYREVEVRLLTDRRATRDAVEDALFWLEEQVTANDVAKIFFAGHGINDNTGELHLAPYDVDVERLRRTGIPASDIVDTISYLQGRVVFFMDACHSGNLDFVRRGPGGIDLNGIIQDLSAAENGAVVFSSAAGNQYALESPRWQNGAFTKAILSAFDGAGDYNGDGAVSVNELNLYVSEEVKRLTNNRQTPVLQKPDSIRDFPLGLVER